MAFRNKKEHLLQYDPDILIVQECESPSAKGRWTEFDDWLWIGEDQYKGLGIFSRNGISLESGRLDSTGGRFSLPVTTDTSFDILGLWAMNDRQQPRNRYIAQVYRTVRAYREWIDGDTIIAGDFNWNVIWDDSPKSPLRGDFSVTVDLLAESGHQSVYHALRDVAFGDEDDPTFYMHKDREKPYHIDYLFAPEKLIDPTTTQLSVGDYENWTDASDHTPLIADFSGSLP